MELRKLEILFPQLEREMKKFAYREWTLAAALLLGALMIAPQPASAQDHVVSPGQIQSEVSSASATRRQNENELRSFLATKEMQKVIKSQGADPQVVMNGVSQLSNAELANLAARSQKAQQDFAAGTIGLGIFTLIGIIVVVIILIALFA